MKHCLIISLLCIIACNPPQLKPVSVHEFNTFVQATNYVTDAERYGWTIVQVNIDSFNVIYGADYTCPTGEYEALLSDPVTQVSYNDALAFAKWEGSSLPNYEEYWDAVVSDKRSINANANSILPIEQVNIIGNVWEITEPSNNSDHIRLAGGSYLCRKDVCNGTDPNRELFVDKETGNSHIGFAILK